MTESENRTAGDLFCDGPRPSDLRKCSIQCPQKRCVLSPWSNWVSLVFATSAYISDCFQSQCSRTCSPSTRYQTRSIIEFSHNCDFDRIQFETCQGKIDRALEVEPSF